MRAIGIGGVNGASLPRVWNVPSILSEKIFLVTASVALRNVALILFCQNSWEAPLFTKDLSHDRDDDKIGAKIVTQRNSW